MYISDKYTQYGSCIPERRSKTGKMLQWKNGSS